MFTLTLSCFVDIGLLLMFSVKFGHFTPPTEFPTSMTPSASSSTQKPDNIRCDPDAINLSISDDLPQGDNSTEILLSCNNWGNKNLTFILETTFDEGRYFSLQNNAVVGNLSYLGLTIKRNLKIRTWITVVRVEERSKNITLNRVPINISSIEVNDRPIIQQDVKASVREDASIGTFVANLSISDPDTGSFGQLNLIKKNDIPEEFELVKISNSTIQIRTKTALDADKYWKNSDPVSEGGPILRITVQVRDGGGLTAVSFVDVTIIDIGDNKPVCKNDTLEIETSSISKGDHVTSLHQYCTGQNYINRTVRYRLHRDNCKAFHINSSGNVVLTNDVFNNIKSCNLTVNVTDVAFPRLTTNFSLIIRFRTCPNDTDYMNNPWNIGRVGKFSVQKCPSGYNGIVTRYCDVKGVYQDPIYNCTKSSIDIIHRKLINDKSKGYVESVDIIDALDKLTNATSETDEDRTLLIGDIDTTLDTLSIITDVITVNTTRLENITDSFISTVNNVLDESTSKTWTVNINQTGSGANIVLKNTDRFVEKILTTAKNVTAEISKSNLYVKIGSVKSCMEALNFPERESAGVSEWARSRQDELVIDCDSSAESFSGIMYRNLSKIIPVTSIDKKGESLQLNAPVISFTLYPYQKRLVSPVVIKFQLYNNSWDNAKCSFLKESHGNSSHGYWSDEGCRHKKDDQNKDVVVCVCDHLTNFAVLMNPSSAPIDEGHLKALSIISLIGCIISIVCLVLTVAIHAFFWRFIKSVRSIIHVNLSCALIIAYTLFLAGINRTENKDVCTAMSVLLHLAFLIVIFGMLTEGCNLSYTVLKPLSTRKPGIPLLIASYVLAVLIVVVSMGATQLEGYGTETACWLSTDTGLIWAFLVPVFVVVLMNIIIVVLVIRTMCNTTAMSKKSSKGRAKAALRCILILMPVMGLTWVFGALSVNEDTVIFQYLFAFLNSFQGLLIFAFHCLMDKKIKDAFRKQKSKWFQSTSFGTSEGRKLKTQDTSDL